MSSRIAQVLAVLALLAAAANVAQSARILVVIPISARSHHIAISAVTRALADKGHDVTFFTGLPHGNKINPANNKVISVGHPFQHLLKKELKTFWVEKSPFETMKFLLDWGVLLVNKTISNPLLTAELNKPGQKYDLVMIEAFFFQESLVALGHQFNCPVVAINPFGTSQWINDLMGNPVNPSWVPSPFLGFTDHMSFTQRLLNTALHVFTDVMYKYYYIPMQQAVLDLHWPDAPPLSEMLRTKVSLTLVNNHFTMSYPAPMSPNVVEIGGIHIAEKAKPLPKDLQDFMDSAKNGVVYLSFGSNINTTDMPKEKAEAILGALGSIKENVLLKWDAEKPKNVASNIRIIEWAPQADILAHPNLRVFITHGGLLSTQESVYNAVPLVGIPLFGDQKFNMKIAVLKGFCVKLDFKDLTKEALLEALEEVLQNPKYKENAKRLSKLFRSKPLTPSEAAVFAVEHILEHGADHLRPASVNMPLYQILLLDVLLVALAPVLMLLLCCRALCCGKRKAVDSSSASKRKKNN